MNNTEQNNLTSLLNEIFPTSTEIIENRFSAEYQSEHAPCGAKCDGRCHGIQS